MAKVPFSDETIFLVLEKLKDTDFVQSLIDELRRLFKVLTPIVLQSRSLQTTCTFISQTDKGFDRSTFDKQMSVMRGQV